MQLLALPAFADNYIWLLHDSDGQALVVDPGDAAVVEAALERHGLTLRAILVTHHHADHIGGLAALRLRHDPVVYGPDDARLEADRIVGQGDVVTLDRPCARFEVLEVPGHTLSHIAFVGAGLLFCGDTLFSLGCGRLFEGTPAQMLASLDRLAALPGHLQVCCAHEYTVANGRFAHEVDPANQALAARCEAASKARSEGLPTLPVALSSELACNPFLRIDSDALVAWGRHHGADDRTARFAALRAAKDTFR